MNDLNPIARARSLLFVPGHQPGRFAKALASGADAVILDLEDAVPLDAKQAARAAIAADWPTWTALNRSRTLVRINPRGSAHWADDLE